MLDSLSAISRVDVAIDSVSYGQATYGGSRTDVCQDYPGRPGCPYVGWNFSLNTAALVNGSHTAAVTVWTSESIPRQTTATRIFLTSNASPSAQNSSIVDIDAPVWNSTLSGRTQFSGWAVDNSSTIAAVNISIDGHSWGAAQYGISRPDVAKVYPGRPGSPNFGWAFPIDTSLLDDGVHSLTISAITSDAAPRVSSVVIDFETDNSQASLIAIDLPVAQQTYSGVQQFAGWAENPGAAIGVVSIAIDGVAYGNATYGNSRADACSADGNDPGCPNIGWLFSINTASLTNGQHTLTVTAFTNEDEYVETSATILFNSSNANPAVANLSLVHVDVPGPNNIYSGQAGFGGWAIDNSSAIASVNIAIDGISYGAAPYGGSRPDVCTAYPGRAGCPNVGWSFDIDTESLSDGVHTLTVTALTANSPPRPTTATVLFTTSNSQLGWLDPKPALSGASPAAAWGFGE